MGEFKKCSKCKRDLPSTDEFFNKDKLRHDNLFPYCKECRGHRFKVIPIASEGNYICAKCKRELPAKIEYFHKDKNSSTGFYCYCRECRGYSFRKIVPKGHKNCIKCNEIFPATDEYFFKRIDSRDGHMSVCRECHGKRGKLNYFSNIKEMKEKNKAYRQTKHGRDIARLIFQRYKAKKKDLPATLTKEQWEYCLSYFDHKDAYTGLPMEIISQDHFIPLSKGGWYTIDNIIPCEKSVNSSKQSRLFSSWYPSQPFYSPQREQKILDYLGYHNGIQQLALI